MLTINKVNKWNLNKYVQYRGQRSIPNYKELLWVDKRSSERLWISNAQKSKYKDPTNTWKDANWIDNEISLYFIKLAKVKRSVTSIAGKKSRERILSYTVVQNMRDLSHFGKQSSDVS